MLGRNEEEYLNTSTEKESNIRIMIIHWGILSRIFAKMVERGVGIKERRI